VLASDIPVLREVAGGHARLVPPTDVDGWADALATVAAPDGASRAAAAEWAARHTWTACARATVAAYERAAA
jgi:glycosyltransferase involved in cell wall biosynthesis